MALGFNELPVQRFSVANAWVMVGWWTRGAESTPPWRHCDVHRPLIRLCCSWVFLLLLGSVEVVGIDSLMTPVDQVYSTYKQEWAAGQLLGESREIIPTLKFGGHIRQASTVPIFITDTVASTGLRIGADQNISQMTSRL